MKKLIFEIGKVPGYRLVPDIADATRMEVIIDYGPGMTLFTRRTLEELGFSDEEPPIATMPMKELTLGDASIKEPAGFVSESGLVSIVAMCLGKTEVPK